MNHPVSQRAADILSISLSSMCTLHCLALPALVALAPAVGNLFFNDESFHGILLALTIPISIFALLMGCKKHKSYSVAGIGVAGLVIISSPVIAELLFHIHNELFEVLATVAGSLLIVAAHMINYRLCRTSDCDHSAGDCH